MRRVWVPISWRRLKPQLERRALGARALAAPVGTAQGLALALAGKGTATVAAVSACRVALEASLQSIAQKRTCLCVWPPITRDSVPASKGPAAMSPPLLKHGPPSCWHPASLLCPKHMLHAMQCTPIVCQAGQERGGRRRLVRGVPAELKAMQTCPGSSTGPICIAIRRYDDLTSCHQAGAGNMPPRGTFLPPAALNAEVARTQKLETEAKNAQEVTITCTRLGGDRRSQQT